MIVYGKYRVVEKFEINPSHTRFSGSILECKKFLFDEIDKDYTRIMTIEKNPNYRPSFDEWQDEFIKEMAAMYGVPECILRPDLSWTDPLKEKTEMKNIDYEAIRKILRNSVVSTKEAVDNLERAMEEVCVMASTSPQLIQGYTAEQWQEIIDGGYLCEFSLADDDMTTGKMFGKLNSFDEKRFLDHDDDSWLNCRPAQLKGVMRPIFVEPVDGEARLHFFAENPCLKFHPEATYEMAKDDGATKYIEV